MDFDSVDWDDGNLDHATSHGVSAEEIERAISNAVEFRRSSATVIVAASRRERMRVATSSSSSNYSAADELDRSRHESPRDPGPHSGHD